MADIFEEVEAAYLARALKTYSSVVRRTDIARLLEKYPELVNDEIQSINTYFVKHRTLVGLATKSKDN